MGSPSAMTTGSLSRLAMWWSFPPALCMALIMGQPPACTASNSCCPTRCLLNLYTLAGPQAAWMTLTYKSWCTGTPVSACQVARISRRSPKTSGKLLQSSSAQRRTRSRQTPTLLTWGPTHWTPLRS
eukprot:jgi/Astpho2/5287/Aster-04854